MRSDLDDDSSILFGSDHLEHDEVHKRQKLQGEEAENLGIARREDKAVACLRFVLFLVLCITACLVLTGTFWFTRNDEIDDFHNDFRASADRVVEAFHATVDRRLGATDALATMITSQSLNGEIKPPNMIVNDFEVIGDNIRVLGDALAYIWYPLITDETRDEYETFSRANYEWMGAAQERESDLKRRQDARYNYTQSNARELHAAQRTLEESEPSPVPMLWGLTTNGSSAIRPPGAGPYVAVWHTSPAYPYPDWLFFYNFDGLTHPAAAISMRETLASGLAVLDTFQGVVNQDSDIIADHMISNSQYRHNRESYILDPYSLIEYPVFDSFGKDRKVAGLLTSTIYWRMLFQNIASKTARLIVVVSNSYGQTMSYNIDGPDVQFMGEGDRHKSKFNDLVVRANVNEYSQQRARPEKRSFTTVGLSQEVGVYQLRVYPRQEMEDEYLTPAPFLLTLLVGCVFAFTTLVFVLYDMIVARRQRIVLARAIQSGAIVSSLYPKAVREQLFENDNDKNKDALRKSNTFGGANKGLMRGSVNRGKPAAISFGENNIDKPKENKHIAEHYHESTILFADLAGFTKWSSSRKPDQVFLLLESLFAEFDALAAALGVFKIETIGDCYVAVCGVPNAQPKHGVIMAKFANEILRKTSEITNRLSESLGAETVDLGLRIGLHSGPVTAGVLRGQRSRFQLFGPSVETACRIESAGMKGRIHVTEATAKELVKHGKPHWVVRRDDNKGEGKQQQQAEGAKGNDNSTETTYWVNIRGGRTKVQESAIDDDVVDDDVVDDAVDDVVDYEDYI